MRGHNFDFKSIEQPFMQSTMKSNFKQTDGFLQQNDLKAAKDTQKDLRQHHFDLGKANT